MCRAVDGNGDLVDRGEGKVGCISDEECQMHTDKGSWCKNDGTCQGCDGPGCCVIPGAEPLVPQCGCGVIVCPDDDICVCNGEEALCVEVNNPEEPECRQSYTIGNVDHLVPRDGGVMGCTSDEECRENTDRGSYCKQDGTCQGCEDWTGCCELEGGNPAEPNGALTPCDLDSAFSDMKCMMDLMCMNTYCKAFGDDGAGVCHDGCAQYPDDAANGDDYY
eukprot:TRINITY_DN10362_c0_g1_i1.p1 TRINITY_DN10362_c0_g1~~TRINITY_DN10362_c0_g1_i1.p1  ORF type:complete len:231 (-),score=31.42 TRINITY_DN10362_c0_g1_i1:225-884(-)